MDRRKARLRKENRIMIKDMEKPKCPDMQSGGPNGNLIMCGHPAGSIHCGCCGPSLCTQFSFEVFKDGVVCDGCQRR